MLPGIKLFDLTNRVAVITGGSKGLGLAIAEGLASAGASVMLVTRHGAEAMGLDAVRRPTGGRAVWHAEELTYAVAVPATGLGGIREVALEIHAMLRDALDAWVRRDTALAQSVLDRDDELDGLKTQVFRELLTYMLQNQTTIEPSLDLILISRHLERIGDHATNVAEDVIFMVSARDVRHHATD